MDITIPTGIRYNSRDYSLTEVIELDSSMRGDSPENHPLFKMMLRYLASPFSDNDYDAIEDNLLHILNPAFMRQLSERDSDIVLDEDEYREHINYAWKKLQELTTEELLRHLLNYVGDTKQLKTVLSQGLLEQGKKTKVGEINTELGTDHVLSAHTKGIESKKIFQAGDKKIPYKPALELINEMLEDEVNQGEYVEVEITTKRVRLSLPNGNKKVDFTESVYSIDINFKKLFGKLFENEGIAPIKKSYPITKAVRKYTPPSGYPLSDVDRAILEDINLKQEWNDLHDSGEFEYDDEEDGKLSISDVKDEMEQGRMLEVRQVATKLKEAGLMSEKKLDDILSEGKIFAKLPYDEQDLEMVSKVVNWKRDNNVSLDEFETMIMERKADKLITTASKESKRRVKPIVHGPLGSPHAEKRFFIDDSWANPENITIDLENAARNSRAINESLYKDALVPDKVGILNIELTSVIADENVLAERQALLEDDEEDVRENSKYLLDHVYNVFYLDSVSYKILEEYEFRDWTERSPESRYGDKQKKFKFERYKRGQSKDESGKVNPLLGRVDAGGQPTNVSVKSNTILYYIKRQMSNLQRVLG
tara:strand:+ start:16661 stop:18439 length:1779 start_codon:yes stop_codon:yes gene_type:complete